MATVLIPVILADGYGISFADVQFRADVDGMYFELPTILRRGQLTLIAGENNTLFPAIKIGKEVTICMHFTVYLKQAGWRDVNLARILGMKASQLSEGILELKLLEPKFDMAGYELPVPMEDMHGD